MKIVGINIILPNYEAKYKVNEKIKISSTSGINYYDLEEEKVLSIEEFTPVPYEVPYETSYRIITDKNKEIIIQDKQLGIQVIWNKGE